MDEVKDAKFEQLLNDVGEIKTTLKGYDGYPGLCQRYESLAKDYFNFKRWVIGIFCTLAGSGVLGASIYKILTG